MKKLIICLIIAITIITGCRYKEGPMISFNSVEKRITGTWQIVEFTSDDVDSLQYYNDSCGSKMVIGGFHYPDGSPTNDPKISFVGGKKEFGGHLSFPKNKKEMQVFFGYPHFTVIGPFVSDIVSYWKILKLTKNELKVSVDFDSRNYIISFKKE